MSMIERVWEKARGNVKRIVLPEGDEPRTVQAAARIRDEGLARPILLGDADAIRTPPTARRPARMPTPSTKCAGRRA